MKIAFTHNLQLNQGSEEEAEFDRPETVGTVTQALRDNGHEVEPLEVSGPASRVVARLEALNPDLVFNTAEGSQGRFREGFYPALFDRLGIPFTGSDAYVCAITLDKQLTKMILHASGVPVPRGKVIEDLSQIDALDFRYPLMVKPNFEGSSMGITADSVVESPEELRKRLVDRLSRYPSGILVEEFITGRDIVVPYLEKASAETGGMLEPASYEYDPEYMKDRKYPIFDFEAKNYGFDVVDVRVPAEITPEQRAKALAISRTVCKVLGIRDVARIDYRMTSDGELYFLEVNALPSLEDGASIYRSGALAGLQSESAVIDTIVRSAAERYGLSWKSKRRAGRKTKLRVGVTYNLKGGSDASGDRDAEYDTRDTIAAIRKAIQSYGHEVVELEASPELPAILPASSVDLVFNVAEGFEGRHREAQVPALLELLGISYTGSDPTALSLALDKGLAKKLVLEAGFRTPAYMLMRTGRERLPSGLQFPVIVKPVAEGSSKGVLPENVLEDEAQLREAAKRLSDKYRQPVLVESYLPGREFTVAMLGEKRPRVLAPMEVIFTETAQKRPVYSHASKAEGRGIRYANPAKLEPALRRDLERVARGVFGVLGCRDMARIDLRLDARNRVHFLDCNPLPGLAPGFSDFVLIAEGAGLDYRTLIGEILAPAMRRWRERRKERLLEGRW